jgi:hypothetical protein
MKRSGLLLAFQNKMCIVLVSNPILSGYQYFLKCYVCSFKTGKRFFKLWKQLLIHSAPFSHRNIHKIKQTKKYSTTTALDPGKDRYPRRSRSYDALGERKWVNLSCPLLPSTLMCLLYIQFLKYCKISYLNHL